MKKEKLYYDYIIQQKINDCWYDYYISYDRKIITDVLHILRKKYVYDIFRVVRSVR